MQCVNLATASITTSISELLSSADANAATSLGLNSLVVNPSVDIVLVDASGTTAAVPGSVAGTVANSPWVCPAGFPTVISHRGGKVSAISTSGTATVKRGLGLD